MKHLANIDEVGRGIAVAFVATHLWRGVGQSVLPAGRQQIESRARSSSHTMREFMLEGVLGIAEGLNPKLIRVKLETFAPPGKEPAAESQRGAAPAAMAAKT